MGVVSFLVGMASTSLPSAHWAWPSAAWGAELIQLTVSFGLIKDFHDVFDVFDVYFMYSSNFGAVHHRKMQFWDNTK